MNSPLSFQQIHLSIQAYRVVGCDGDTIMLHIHDFAVRIQYRVFAAPPPLFNPNSGKEHSPTSITQEQKTWAIEPIQ